MKTLNLTKNPMIALIALCLAAACGKNSGSNAGTNVRTVGQTSNVSIGSQSIAVQGFTSLASLLGFQVQAVSVPNLKICIRRIKLVDNSNVTVKKTEVESSSGHNQGSESVADDDRTESEKSNGEMLFSPGLIDLSSGATLTWGSVALPVGFSVSKIVMKAQKDLSRCGVSYSVSHNSIQTEEEIELKWKFSPPLDLSATTTQIALGLNDISTALLNGGQVSNKEELKNRMESIEEDNASFR